MGRWAQPRLARDQITLFSPTLDDLIGEDHPVRLFDEILSELDWSEWESRYNGHRGQPPIHPRVMAGVLLYGLTLGIRSSRKLEWSCGNAIDVMWLTSGRVIDHSTLCGFRTSFRDELKGLFVQIGRLAMQLGLVRLNQVGLDGTRVQANSSRRRTVKGSTLEERLAALDVEVERLLSESEETDRRERRLFGDDRAGRLPRELSALKARQERLRRALAASEEKGGGKVPVADPESAVLPNKDGGYAPNYTPTAGVDGHGGYIVDADVSASAHESDATVATVDRIEEQFGERPKQFLADADHGTGPNLSDLAEREVEAYIPVSNDHRQQDNPADRADPREAVSESAWEGLPRSRQTKKLDKSAFVYDASSDAYWCPQGRRLEFAGTETKICASGPVQYRRYVCGDCRGCGLSPACRSGQGPRSVKRDEHEAAREATAARLRSEEGQTVHARRLWLCETPFAVLKGVMGVRQFLLRGRWKVGLEWLWSCTAYNLRKLLGEPGLRARVAALSG